MSAADLSPATPERPARRSWLDRWFGPVQVPPEVVAELRELSRRGSLAFVMRSSGMLNFLFVRWWVRRLGLPPLRASVGSDWLIPTFFGVRRSRRALDEAISRGHTSVVFLNTHHDGHDPFAALCGRQRKVSTAWLAAIVLGLVFFIPALWLSLEFALVGLLSGTKPGIFSLAETYPDSGCDDSGKFLCFTRGGRRSAD